MTESLSEFVLPRLYERDIDVLLQEELLFSDSVRSIFIEALDLPSATVTRRCELSVSDASGETDVFATFSDGKNEFAVLIENKIDASFQPRQPERYKERTQSLVSENRFARAFCVLVAPNNYAQVGNVGLEHFDKILAYEDIAAAMRTEGSARAIHRADLLLRAVNQARSAYALVPVAEISDLWRRVYAIASSEFPALRMKPPGDKGAGGYWILFKADLPASISIDWKIKLGVVDLSFWKNAAHHPRKDIDLSKLRSDAALVQLNETLAIRLQISKPVDSWTGLSDHEIREALEAAVTLRAFYRSRPESFV